MCLIWTCDKNTKDGRCKEIYVLIAVYFSRVSTYEVVFILLPHPPPNNQENKTTA